jgi:uncharacterized protein
MHIADHHICNIALFITQECNQNCIYCYGAGGSYGSSGHMSTATAKRAVDWLIEQSGVEKELSILFFGGEPLMNFPLIKEVVSYTQKRSKEQEKEFYFSITTNLSLLDNEKLAFLKKHNITVTVSFDGSKEIQDKQRPFKTGNSSSFDSTIPKIKELLSIMPDSVCRPTVYTDNDLNKIKDSLISLGFSNINILYASPSSLDNNKEIEIQNSNTQLRLIETDAEFFLKNIKERNTKELQREKTSGSYCELTDYILNNKKKYFGCGAGRNYVGISNIGDVYLCHRMVGTNECKLGNIFEKNLERTPYLTSPLATTGKCSKCNAKYLCAGGCYYDNKAMTGSLFEPPEGNCKIVRRLMELLSYVTDNLTEEDKAYLIKENFINKQPSSRKEIYRKRQKLINDLEALGLTEDEFMQAKGMTF